MPFFISAGFLCGSCPSGSWVSLDILSCSDTCEVGVVLFFIWCKLVIHLYSSHSCIHACAQPDQLWHQMQLGTQACLWMCIPTGAVVIGVSLLVLILDIGHPAELRAFIYVLCRSTYVCVCVCTCLPTCICMPVHLCCSPSVSNSLIQYK